MKRMALSSLHDNAVAAGGDVGLSPAAFAADFASAVFMCLLGMVRCTL
jgi:hypothetical protein